MRALRQAMPLPSASSSHVAVIGGGPAGLMAAEVLSRAGVPVDLFDAMPSVGRKFLLAGRGGLNLTHSEPPQPFLERYAERRDALSPWVQAFMSLGNTRPEVPTKVAMPRPAAHSRTAGPSKACTQGDSASRRSA